MRGRKKYNFGSGVNAFWNWLGRGDNAPSHKDEIRQVFTEVKRQRIQGGGSVAIDLRITSMFPNDEVSASPFVLVMHIQDGSGSITTIASTGDPTGDTGAQDSNGEVLPIKVVDNKSTITFNDP